MGIKKSKKVMVSGRIPTYVKEYCEKNNITISKLLMQGFDSFRSTDKEHAVTRLEYHEKRVLHWRHIVLQHDEECNTKYHICNTIKKEFKKYGRGSPETRKEDMFWIKSKSESLQDEGVIITPKELYQFCINE